MNNKLQMNPNKGPEAMNVQASLKDDMVMCECGSTLFLQAANVVKVIPPIIGADPILYPVPQTMRLICLGCRREINPDVVKSMKEKNTGVSTGTIGGN